ncbi:MAG: hypothetical protein ACRDQW_19065, partial [Haloechinothrix sp.]
MGRRSRAGSATAFLGAYRVEAVAVLTALLITGGSGMFSSPAGSTPTYLDQFNSKYGTQGSKLNSCATCHSNPSAPNAGNLNPYGTDFAGNNHDFAAIEPKDSDGDGHTNIDEINARTFPGDPASNPASEPPPPPKPAP